MSDTNDNERKVKIISLPSRVVFVDRDKQAELNEPSGEDAVIAPFLLDQEEAIEDIGDLISKVHDEFSSACAKLDLNWTAELELGLEFGVKFAVKLQISPKSSDKASES